MSNLLFIDFNRLLPRKTKERIAKLIIETEINNKHKIKKELGRKLRETNLAIGRTLTFLTYQAIKYRIRNRVQKEKTKWLKTHARKLETLRQQIPARNKNTLQKFAVNVIHNFSSHILSKREREVLSYTLDHYVDFKVDVKRIEVEFEKLYQDIVPHTTHLTADDKVEMKSKFLSIFQRYSKIRYKNEDRFVIEGLKKNDNIFILKQDKGRGLVIMNRSDYIKKCDDFLSTDNFQKLDSNPTKSFQSKVQRTLKSMKSKFDKNVYKKLYPSSSQPGLFFGLAKIHKMQPNDKNVDNLPIRPVISNIGTATYQTSKYLAELLKPLAKSQYTMDSTDNFLERIKNIRVDNGYDMVSFDVVSLFTNVPIEYTIDVILDKVFNNCLITVQN